MVEVDGAPVWFAATAVVLGLEQGWTAELQDLYVATGHRNRGLAAKLIDGSAAWTTGRGAQALEVVLAPQGGSVEHLLRYYTARGFPDDGRRLLSGALD